MDWEFTEDAAFLALCDAFRESGESSAIEFLANGEGAFHFQDLAQNAAGEGIDGQGSEKRRCGVQQQKANFPGGGRGGGGQGREAAALSKDIGAKRL